MPAMGSLKTADDKVLDDLFRPLWRRARTIAARLLADGASTQAIADELFSVVGSGQVKVHVTQRFPLAQVQAAHRALEARETTGSVILTV